jgi:hypothetical protein
LSAALTAAALEALVALGLAAGLSAAGASAAGAGAVAVSTAGSLGTVIWSVDSVLMGSRDSWHPVRDVVRVRAGEMPYE